MSVLCKNSKSFRGKEYAAFGNMSLLLSILVQCLTQLALKFYSTIFLNCNVSLSCLQSLAQILFFILVHVHFFTPFVSWTILSVQIVCLFPLDENHLSVNGRWKIGENYKVKDIFLFDHERETCSFSQSEKNEVDL